MLDTAGNRQLLLQYCNYNCIKSTSNIEYFVNLTDKVAVCFVFVNVIASALMLHMLA